MAFAQSMTEGTVNALYRGDQPFQANGFFDTD